MGVVKKALKIFSPVAMLAGLGKDEKKSAPAPQQKGPTEEQKQADAKAKQEEDRRKRLLALQQSGQQPGQLTGPGGVQGQGQTARKQLLGL